MAGRPEDVQSFSYWENWPSPTGYAPSLEVLARLAELYECQVADLLADGADFRSRDAAHRARSRLAELSDAPDSDTADGWLARLDDLGVPELAGIASAWAATLPTETQQGRLLKLSAGLALAGASAVSSGEPEALADEPAGATDRLTGIWHSRYVYFSSGRGSEYEGRHYVVLRWRDGRLVGESLPHTTDSSLRLDLAVDGAVVTGTWSEQTSPTGYYRGATYHGSLQLMADPMGRSMTGKLARVRDAVPGQHRTVGAEMGRRPTLASGDAALRAQGVASSSLGPVITVTTVVPRGRSPRSASAKIP